MSAFWTTRRAAAVLAVVGAVGVASPDDAGSRQSAQDLEVVVERTELRWSSTGRLLGHLLQGTPLERLGGRGGWTRAGVSGWMWRPSLAVSGDQFRITPRRENLRASPNGEVLGTLERGVEVRRVETRGQWFRIEMIGWLPDTSVRETDANVAEEPEAEPEAEPASPPAATSLGGRLTQAAPVRLSPNGDDAGSLPEGVPVEAVETRGDWTRVRLEAWVPSGAVAAATGGSPSPGDVARSPEEHAGRSVTWIVQHVALQQADEWRTDFEPGEIYDLVRDANDRTQYAYVVVPEALRSAFEELAPFERVRIRGTVRTGRSELTGNPVIVAREVLP